MPALIKTKNFSSEQLPWYMISMKKESKATVWTKSYKLLLLLLFLISWTKLCKVCCFLTATIKWSTFSATYFLFFFSMQKGRKLKKIYRTLITTVRCHIQFHIHIYYLNYTRFPITGTLMTKTVLTALPKTKNTSQKLSLRYWKRVI